MSKALELRSERKQVADKMSAILNQAEPNLPEWRRLDGIQSTLGDKIVALERTDALSTEMRSVRNVQRPNIGTEDNHVLSGAELVRSTASYKADFDTYLRSGRMSPALVEQRALGAATGADGATLVPQGFEEQVETVMRYYSGIIDIAKSLVTSTGNPLPYPTMDDSSNVGEFLAEGGGVGAADPTFSNVVFGANLVSSKQVKVSVALEQDSAFDMATLLSEAFGVRLGRILGQALWTGDGSTIPITGLLTALQAAGGRSVLAVGGNTNDGASTDLNSVGTDDFDNLISKLDYAYQRPTNRFIFNQITLNTFRKLKDKYGRPVWQTSLSVGQPDTICGYGYKVDNNLANIGAGNISVAFGDFSKYIIRKALGYTLVRFNELYMVNFQRAYQMFGRFDAKLIQPLAFSYLTHPLS